MILISPWVDIDKLQHHAGEQYVNLLMIWALNTLKMSFIERFCLKYLSANICDRQLFEVFCKQLHLLRCHLWFLFESFTKSKSKSSSQSKQLTLQSGASLLLCGWHSYLNRQICWQKDPRKYNDVITVSHRRFEKQSKWSHWQKQGNICLF